MKMTRYLLPKQLLLSIPESWVELNPQFGSESRLQEGFLVPKHMFLKASHSTATAHQSSWRSAFEERRLIGQSSGPLARQMR